MTDSVSLALFLLIHCATGVLRSCTCRHKEVEGEVYALLDDEEADNSRRNAVSTVCEFDSDSNLVASKSEHLVEPLDKHLVMQLNVKAEEFLKSAL